MRRLKVLQQLGIKTAISDPLSNRRVDKLPEMERTALEAARRTVSSKSGKALLKLRAELVERGFQHVLDCGGARRTTLRGRANIRKRYLIQAACANLSLLMRRLSGIGTLKQALAAPRAAMSLVSALLCLVHDLSALESRQILRRLFGLIASRTVGSIAAAPA